MGRATGARARAAPAFRPHNFLAFALAILGIGWNNEPNIVTALKLRSTDNETFILGIVVIVSDHKIIGIIVLRIFLNLGSDGWRLLLRHDFLFSLWPRLGHLDHKRRIAFGTHDRIAFEIVEMSATTLALALGTPLRFRHAQRPYKKMVPEKWVIPLP